MTLTAGVHAFLVGFQIGQERATSSGAIGVGVPAPLTLGNPLVITRPLPQAVISLPTTCLCGDPVAGPLVWAKAGCGTCHVLKAAGSTGTAGPSLDDTKPDLSTVVLEVTAGDVDMPAYNSQLTATQINDLAAYVYKSVH